MDYKKFFKNDIFVFFLFLLIFYGIFRYSESFNKGYNIVEDNILIETNKSLETTSFISVWDNQMKTELYSWNRFRPLWVIYLITTVEMFGFNLLLINIFTALLCILTTFLLFKFCFNIGFNFSQSFLFALLTIIGPATILWTRNIDAEIIGMLMLSFMLFFLSKSIYSERHHFFYKFCFIFFLILTSLSKESFLIVVPAVLFLYLFIYSQKNDITILKAIKNNYLIIIIGSILFIIFIASLIKIVGINHEHRYSGVDLKLFSSKTISDFTINIFSKNLFLLSLFAIFIILENGFTKKYKFPSKSLKIVISLLFFMFIVIVPQFIIYYKTGIYERYYLPYLFGMSFTLIYLLKQVSEISIFLKYFFTTTVVVFLLLETFTVTIPLITNYSNECKATTDVVNLIETNPGKKLLFVMDPVQNFWDAYKLKIYIDFTEKDVIYFYDFIKRDYLHKNFADTVYYNDLSRQSKRLSGKNLIDSLSDFSDLNEILVLWSLESKFKNENKKWFNESEFKKKKFGNYTLYLKSQN